MKRVIITLSVLLCTSVFMAQPATKNHIVSKGETITQIAKKYNTTNNVIFLLNPDAVDGVSEHQILKIPTTSEIRHQVQAKETVYGISKQYNIPIEKLYDLNPGLKEDGLKVDQFLNLTESIVASDKVVVEKGETIYGIAVKNNTTVSVLYDLNPGLRENGLKVGHSIKIPGKVEAKSVPTENSQNNNNQLEQTPKTIIVKPKETIYNITKSNNITQEELLKWNPELRTGLKEGDTLIVGYEKTTVTVPSNESTETFITKNSVLSLSSDGSARELVFLLPFNMATNNFSNPSIFKNINSNKFLNMTLEFYSGAQLAINELKSKNYPLNIKFVDSKETNRTLDVNTLKGDFDFASTDVIIGPFFQKNVDAVSETFKNQQTIIVSPLSTSKGEPYPRQIHTMPNNEIIKKEMLGYLVSKQQHIIAITDGHKTSKSYFNANFPDISVLSIGKNEKVGAGDLSSLFAIDKINYVVYDANSLTTSIELIRTLKSLQKTYTIQLVGLEKNEILDSSDISMEDLVALQYTFPSVTNDSETYKKNNFTAKYKTAYGKAPTRFATRGYDVTYDVITRMFESDENSNIFEYGSQQIENKFAYINENGGVYNNAVYILYYDKDFTIKEAK